MHWRRRRGIRVTGRGGRRTPRRRRRRRTAWEGGDSSNRTRRRHRAKKAIGRVLRTTYRSGGGGRTFFFFVFVVLLLLHFFSRVVFVVFFFFFLSFSSRKRQAMDGVQRRRWIMRSQRLPMVERRQRREHGEHRCTRGVGAGRSACTPTAIRMFSFRFFVSLLDLDHYCTTAMRTTATRMTIIPMHDRRRRPFLSHLRMPVGQLAMRFWTGGAFLRPKDRGRRRSTSKGRQVAIIILRRRACGGRRCRVPFRMRVVVIIIFIIFLVFFFSVFLGARLFRRGGARGGGNDRRTAWAFKEGDKEVLFGTRVSAVGSGGGKKGRRRRRGAAHPCRRTRRRAVVVRGGARGTRRIRR